MIPLKIHCWHEEYKQLFYTKDNCAWQHFRQRNTGEQIDKIHLNFEGATILVILLITSVDKLK